MGACRTHEGGSGTNKSAQELTRRYRKTSSHPAPPGGSNPRSSDLNSDPLTSELISIFKKKKYCTFNYARIIITLLTFAGLGAEDLPPVWGLGWRTYHLFGAWGGGPTTCLGLGVEDLPPIWGLGWKTYHLFGAWGGGPTTCFGAWGGGPTTCLGLGVEDLQPVLLGSQPVLLGS